jgi:hypothetical protein
MSPPVPFLFAGLVFEGLQSTWFAWARSPWLWRVLLPVIAVVLYATYRDIYRRSGRSLVWWLMGLRGLGLAFLLLALAKPTWTRESEEVDAGHVIVILDNSRSMSLPDETGGTRYARATAGLERLRRTLEAAKGPRLVLDLFDIEGNSLEKVPDKPTIDRTDLEKALRRSTGKQRLPVGVVLISDGMDNTGRDNFQGWKGTTVPVHGLGFATSVASDLDLAVRKPQAPERAMVLNELSVSVPVVKTGKPAVNVTVAIKRGREIVTSTKLKLPEGNSERLVELKFTPKHPGSFVYTAAVQSEVSERYLGNNAVHFPLRVDAEPIRVLYVEGFLRTEFKYLKARLEDDLDIALASVVRRVSPEENERPARGLFTEKRPKNLDVIILGDMEKDFLADADYRAIKTWLDGKNHSLLVLGGYNSFGPQGFRDTPLADVLPVVFRSGPPFQSEVPFSLRLSDRGQGHPLFALSNDRVKDVAAWNNAPRLEGMSLVQRVKPGAEALAINPSLQIEGKPAPVLAVQRAGGGGQVMALMIDTTWRWSRFARIRGQDDRLFQRFWSQAVRWLAGRSLDEQRPPLTVTTDRPDYDVGKKVTVTVTRQTDAAKGKGQVRVEITRPSGEVLPPLPLKEDPGNRDVFRGEYYPSVGGRYEVTATLTGDGKPLANQQAEFMVQGSDLELANTGTNPGNLKALADATGGVYLDVDRAEELAEKIERKERRSPVVRRTEYWNSPWLFTAFLLAVTGEWFIRRRNHLV